jgi:hypothetical protein
MRKNEVNLLEAVEVLEVSEEILGKLAEQGNLKVRRADGTIYFFARGDRRASRSPNRGS